MRGVTREEAVLLLLNLQDQVHLVAQYCRDEYDEIVASQKGDSFYIRTHFSYESGGKGELGFHVGEVFRVVDTLHNGTVGSWLVFRLGRNHQEIQKGVIPNRTRAEELSQAQQSQAKKEASAESSRGSFFKRRSARRAKALCKDHWEDVLCDGLSKFPAYERVTLKHPGFIRPVVLFGPMADVARDKLLRDYPDKYASPQLDGHLEELPKSQKASGIIRLSAIKEIIDKSKHALLDITPSAVDRLNYAQFYPVVVFMRAESKHTVKELRSRLARTPHHKSARKLYDRALKLERLWGHIFTSTVTLTSADMWYKKLRETIEKQQQLSIWVSESKPEEAISDDFLFPMTSRLSYASSPESDLDLACPSEGRALGPEDRRLMRASSDPSVATQEDAFAAPSQQQQPAPPPYSSASPGSSSVLLRNARPEQGLHSHQSSQDYGSSKRNTLTTEQRYQAPAYSSHEAPSGGQGRQLDQQYYGHLNGHTDGYPPEEQFPPGTGGRLHGDQQDTYGSKPRLLPEPPPQVDRGSKPPRFSRSAQERLFGSPGRGGGEPPPQALSPDYINTGSPSKSGSLDRPNGRPMPGYDSSSYSSDSYGRYAGLQQQQQQLHPSVNPHDPYRFTRSTVQPPHGARPPPGRGGAPPLHSPSNDGLCASDASRHRRLGAPERASRRACARAPDGGGDRPGRSPTVTGHALRRSTHGTRHTKVRLSRATEVHRFGDLQSPEEFVDRLNSFCLLNAIKPEDRVTHVVPAALEGSARLWFQFTGPFADWALFVAAFRKEFAPIDSKKRLKEELRRYTQHPEENLKHLEEFAKAADGLTERAWRLLEYVPPPLPTTQVARDLVFRSQSVGTVYPAALPPVYSAALITPGAPTSHGQPWPLHPVALQPSFYRDQLAATAALRPPLHAPSAFGVHQASTSGGRGRQVQCHCCSGRGYLARQCPTGRPQSPPGPPPYSSRDGGAGGNNGYAPRPPPLPPLHQQPNGGPYLNLPHPPRGGGGGVPPTGLLDLSNREHRGSAFELYRKPEPRVPSHAPYGTNPHGSLGLPDIGYPETLGGQDCPPGGEVVATASGVFGAPGGILSSPETGVSIVIPAGAIPEGVSQEIFFKVCRDSSMLPPLDRDKGETLLSPLVMCGPHGLRFRLPVELRLPHCAALNPESWSFALKSSDTPDGKPAEWQNVSLDNMEGVMSSHVEENYVSVLVDHF
ncbi:unnamed protein product [Ixodes hexagonus]